MSPCVRLKEQGFLFSRSPSVTAPTPLIIQHRGTTPVPPDAQPSQAPGPLNSNLVTAPAATLQTMLPRSSAATFQTKLTFHTNLSGASSPEREACFGSALNCMKLLYKLCQAESRGRERGGEGKRQRKRDTTRKLKAKSQP